MAENLTDLLRRRIALEGPVSVAEYMALALGHPRHGYYMIRDPFGAQGDFVTAPEISQMFGELLGLWLADCWVRMGAPDPVLLVELGPGRGTLMADALRATAKVPGFLTAARLHLVETSPVLRAKQAATLARFDPTWHDEARQLPDGPLLVIANEFFDALPIRQFQRTERGWAERRVGLTPEGALAWTLDPRPGAALVPPALRGAPVGSIFEARAVDLAVVSEMAHRLARFEGAALIIDYGYEGPAVGNTLQAVRGHRPTTVLDGPGSCDLTAHVDFTLLAEAARTAGATAYGPIGQGELLRRLGIQARANALIRLATPEQVVDIRSATERLAAESAMGRLFKALALTGPGGSGPAGFDGGTATGG